MNRAQPILAIVLSALMLAPAGLAQQAVNLDTPQVPAAGGSGFFQSLSRPYRAPDVAPISLSNSNRLESLTRAGKIYLSLDDTIAIALENNLDIELSRYTPQIAQVDLLRAKAGGLLRGVPTAVRQTANSALQVATGGTTERGNANATTTGTADASGGTVITQTGVAIPNLDPTLFFGGNMGHSSRPQANTVTTGATALLFDSRTFQTGYQQSFLSGTTASLGWNNSWVKSNNARSDINPSWSPNINLQLTQRLLQGFGFAVNNRNIRVARNNIRVSDLTFKQQVMTTVAGVVRSESVV